jgi:hypothetical protein
MTVDDFAETCRVVVGRLRQKGEADLLLQSARSIVTGVNL